MSDPSASLASVRDVPQDVLDCFGDFKWWERADAFSHPQAAAFVLNLPGALSALRSLYDAKTCATLAGSGQGRMVFGLFQGHGWMDSVDEVLQLGADLALCAGWETSPRLVAALRSADSFDGARFEVGLWAGFVRRGLLPEVERAARVSDPRPDFVVEAEGIRVALELKTLSDPAFVSNVAAIEDALEHLVTRLPAGWRGQVTLDLSQTVRACLKEGHDKFVREHLPQVERELSSAFATIHHNESVDLPTAGHLVLAYPACLAGESFASSTLVVAGDEPDARRLTTRALGVVREASKQVSAVTVDLRIAVVWGSRHTLPADIAARNAEVVVRERADDWAATNLDWIVFVNCHTLGMSGLCEVDASTCAVPGSERRAIPTAVLEAMQSWGPRYRGE